MQKKQDSLFFISQRAVFQLTDEGVELIEIAPGVDLRRDLLDRMDFAPIIKSVKMMDERIFRNEKMGL